MKRILAALSALALALCALGDTITFHSGGSISGTIMQENSSTITLLYGKSTMKIARSDVKSISRTPKVEPKKEVGTPAKAVARLSTMEGAISLLAQQTWATNLEEIAATVIDVGVLKNVPYKSFRCGADIEVNVYGDPDEPAGIEIGVYGERASSASAQSECMKYISQLLGDPVDAKLLDSLNKSEDKIERMSLTFEITPPTAEDAYGGWWISIYSEELLNKARATDAELKEIAQPRTVTKASTTPKDEKPKQIPQKEAENKSATPEHTGWTEQELSKSRKPKTSSSASSSSGGMVYVKGYYKKDGTYVRPHSRRK